MSRHRPTKAEVEGRKRERRRRKQRGKQGSRASSEKAPERHSRRGPQRESLQLTVLGGGRMPRLSSRHLADLRRGEMVNLTKDHFAQTDHSRSDIAGGVLVFDVIPKAGTTSRPLRSFMVDLNAKTIKRVSK